MPWIQEEAARLSPPEDQVAVATRDREERDRLLEARDRLGLAMTDGLLSREAALAKAAELDGELERLDATLSVVDLPAIDWSWDDESIRSVLSELWDEIRLDEEMMPVEAIWRAPEWRS